MSNIKAENIPAIPIISESGVGFIIFFVCVFYCLLIVFLDSKERSMLVISKNAIRHLLDGLTLSTGVTIALAIFDKTIFSTVASNATYITVTSLTCIFGPIINLAQRYGRLIDK